MRGPTRAGRTRRGGATSHLDGGALGTPRALTLFAAAALTLGACKGAGQGNGADAAEDASSDGRGDAGLPSCPLPDGGSVSSAAVEDDFGPNAVPAKMTSALGRVDIYEVTNPRLLERVDVYLGTPLPQSRLTIAVHEAMSSTAPFRKLADVQVDVPSCLGWASSGTLALPLVAGRYYAIGFDPNQAILPYIDAEADDVPVDGHLGRLIGSKTATSVSIASLTWDKVLTTEFTRQRLATSPRTEMDAGSDAASADAPNLDATAPDATNADGAGNDARDVAAATDAGKDAPPG